MEKEDRKYIQRYSRIDTISELGKIHGKKFVDYRNEWDKASGVNEYAPPAPLFLELNINSDCNLRCKMCSRVLYDESNNRHENMSLELCSKIIEQAKLLNIPAILIGDNSECLLHPDIKGVIKIVKSLNPVDFFLITNGTLLTEDISDFLIDMELDRLEVSVDAIFPETYKKIRGGAFRYCRNKY